MTRRLKAAIALLTLVGVLCLHGSATAAGVAVITANGPSGAVTPGQQFTVNIVVVPNNSIAGAQLNLSFNPALVSANSVAEGNLLKQGGASTYFMAGQIDNAAGAISNVAGVITTPGQTVSNTGTFATIAFTALPTKGTSLLTLSNAVVGDINGKAVAVSMVNGQVLVDRPPVLNHIGSRSVNEGTLLSFTVLGSDPDGDALTYSASNLPTGATFTAANETFSWTPTYSQNGTYPNVHFQVSDGNLIASEDITVTVVEQYPDWDVNGDGLSNILDMILVGQQWGATGIPGWIRQDVNGDGVINVQDMILIGQHWTG